MTPNDTDSILTFIIPVRHPDNSRNWSCLKSNLSQTIKSIAGQDSNLWKAVIVANEGADLPAVPQGVEIKWVTFSPNRLHEQGSADDEQFFDAFRIDKGRRVLAGMLHARPRGHVMIVDDDDFVSCRLATFVAKNRECPGWHLAAGWVWRESGKIAYLSPNFNKLCGTSHIIRADLYKLPQALDEAPDVYVRRMLGSHRFIEDYLSDAGSPLRPLPFPGAVYRVGHPGSFIRSKGILRQFFINRNSLKSPLDVIRDLSCIHVVTGAFRKEFFG
jgi:hypothetical protein